MDPFELPPGRSRTYMRTWRANPAVWSPSMGTLVLWIHWPSPEPMVLVLYHPATLGYKQSVQLGDQHLINDQLSVLLQVNVHCVFVWYATDMSLTIYERREKAYQNLRNNDRLAKRPQKPREEEDDRRSEGQLQQQKREGVMQWICAHKNTAWLNPSCWCAKGPS